ncbi:MAG: hypothetical protein ACP5HM_11365 [Anaerolineae bacterium]
MVEAIIRSMLGPYGNRALDFLLAHPLWVSGVLAFWLALYGAGRVQLSRLRAEMETLIVEEGRHLLKERDGMTPTALHEALAPRWEALLKERKGFIPHRLELWPVPIKPETVQPQLDFSPRHIVEILQQHHVEIEET